MAFLGREGFLGQRVSKAWQAPLEKKALPDEQETGAPKERGATLASKV